MSFNFEWPTFPPEFYATATSTLDTALNRGSKPPIIVGDIKVHELNMGTVPPDLEILEIGDLSRDRFRGIFRLMYSGDAHLVLSIQVQANPLAKSGDGLDTFASPAMSRGMLFAATPLTVPMRVRLSQVKLRAIIVLVVSRAKGITLVFKNDPLESVRVSSTFDGVASIQKYLQDEIEGQLREMFREDLPSIIHRLSQEWLNNESQNEQPPPPPPAPQVQRRTSYSLNDAAPWPVDTSEMPLSMLTLQDDTPGPKSLSSIAKISAQSRRGLKDLVGEQQTQHSTVHARVFHAASHVRAPSVRGRSNVSTASNSPRRSTAPPSASDVAGHLAELLRANHTLSPFTRNTEHVAVRTAPASRASSSSGRSSRAPARQKRVFRLG